jgi:small subunit ribosomal protein S6
MSFMKHYELFYIIPGKYTEEETEAISLKVQEMVKKYGGEITMTDNLGNNRLAYDIKGAQNGSFMVIEFNAEPAGLKELDNALKLNPELTRYQITNKKQETKEEIEKARLRQQKMAEREAKAVSAETAEKAAPAPKVSLEELDKKLGEILSGDII